MVNTFEAQIYKQFDQLEARVKELEMANQGWHRCGSPGKTVKRVVDDGNGLTHEESFSYQPKFTIADRDARIKGLEAELEAQRVHYQGELNKARKAVDTLADEHIRENKRRVEVEDLLSVLQQTVKEIQRELEVSRLARQVVEKERDDLKMETERDKQVFESFGIKVNEYGYWKPKK